MEPEPMPPEPEGPKENRPRPSPAAHLKGHQFQKGKSGNPAGRPRGKTITAALRELSLTEHNGKQLVELLAERIMKEALSGKFPFLKEALERLDGKVPDKAIVESKGTQKLYICPPPRLIGEAGPALPLPPEPEE